MRKGTQLTLEEPNGVSEPLSCLPKALEQHCEVSLAPFCTHLPHEAMSLVCPVQKQLYVSKTLLYICKIPANSLLGCPWLLSDTKNIFFKAWKNTTFLCILFLSTELCFEGENFPGSALCPFQTHLKAPGTL